MLKVKALYLSYKSKNIKEIATTISMDMESEKVYKH
jgi:hypothetical protein